MKQFFIILILILLFPAISFAQELSSNTLFLINQKVCDRFEEDTLKLAAIMDELKRRKGITQTRVAFGGYDTPIKSADYWINYGAEAIAYQRAQKYTSKSQLKYSLEVLKNKIIRAKNETGKALESNE